jgi:hypothetical protein
MYHNKSDKNLNYDEKFWKSIVGMSERVERGRARLTKQVPSKKSSLSLLRETFFGSHTCMRVKVALPHPQIARLSFLSLFLSLAWLLLWAFCVNVE